MNPHETLLWLPIFPGLIGCEAGRANKLTRHTKGSSSMEITEQAIHLLAKVAMEVQARFTDFRKRVYSMTRIV